MVGAMREREAMLDTAMPPKAATDVGGIDNLDDYAACRIDRKEDFKELFVKNFYFGCEADDR